MTASEHDAQREAVRRSLLLAESRADRRDRPLKPRPLPVVVPVAPSHVFVVPVVKETLL